MCVEFPRLRRCSIFEIQRLLERSLCWVILIPVHELLLSTFQCLKVAPFPLYLAECKTQSNIFVLLKVKRGKVQEVARAICLYLNKTCRGILGWDMQMCWVNRQINSNIREINRRTALRKFYCVIRKIAINLSFSGRIRQSKYKKKNYFTAGY
jgi:hypothetical protein